MEENQNNKIIHFPVNKTRGNRLIDLVNEYYRLACLPELSNQDSNKMISILHQAISDDTLNQWIDEIDLFIMEKLEDTQPDQQEKLEKRDDLEKLHQQYLKSFTFLKEKYHKMEKLAKLYKKNKSDYD